MVIMGVFYLKDLNDEKLQLIFLLYLLLEI